MGCLTRLGSSKGCRVGKKAKLEDFANFRQQYFPPPTRFRGVRSRVCQKNERVGQKVKRHVLYHCLLSEELGMRIVMLKLMTWKSVLDTNCAGVGARVA